MHPTHLEYVFMCKTDLGCHHIQYQQQDKTWDGTSSLKASMEVCNMHNNISATPSQSVSAPFSYAMHLASHLQRWFVSGRLPETPERGDLLW